MKAGKSKRKEQTVGENLQISLPNSEVEGSMKKKLKRTSPGFCLVSGGQREP